MALTTGIVGLPNVGKSTLFNAITRAGAESANYPFCTIEPNVGVVDVPDERLNKLTDLIHPQKVVPTACQFVDIAGLVKGASQGEGLGNKFLSHIREVDAVLHVVRCFEDDNITHVSGKVDPVSDMATIQLELILSDMETVEKRLDRVSRQAKTGEKQAVQEQNLLSKVLITLQEEKPARMTDASPEEFLQLKTYSLLTMKDVLYVANVSEDEVANAEENPYVQQVREIAKEEGAGVVTISAQVEAEIAELDGEERDMFLEELGLQSSGLDRLINEAYRLLGLNTFFTAGEKEVRAWTIRKGTKAPQAGAVIHTDFERGFIRAEIVGYEDLMASEGFVGAKEKGLMRLEGKEYVVQDGDIITFRFNV